MADLSGELVPPEGADNGGSMLNILTQDVLEAGTPAAGSKIPVLDLDTFTQDEFGQLAEVCTGLDQEHIRTRELLDPKLERRLGFNESAGSRKQTFRDHPSSKSQKLRRDGEADVGKGSSPSEPLRIPGSKVSGTSESVVRESSPTRRRGRPPRPPSGTDLKPRPLLQGSPVELGLEAATLMEDKDQDITSDEDRERPTRKRISLPEASGLEGEVSEGEKQGKKIKSLDEKTEAQDDQSRLRRGKQGDTSEAKLFEFLKNMVGRWTSDHRRRKIVAANGFPSGWTVCVGLRQKHGRYYFEYRDYTDPEGKTWSSFKEAAAHLVAVAEQSLICENDAISDKAPQSDNDTNLTISQELVELHTRTDEMANMSTGDNTQDGDNILPMADGMAAMQLEVAFGDADLGVTLGSPTEKGANLFTQEVNDRGTNSTFLADKTESGRSCGMEVTNNLIVGESSGFGSTAVTRMIHHRCPVCGEEFQTQQKLRAHIIRLCHMQTFACNVCGLSFQSNFLLLRHRIKKNHPRSPKGGSYAAVEGSASAPLTMKGGGAAPGIAAVDGLAGASADSITRLSGKELEKHWDVDLSEISSHARCEVQPDVLQPPDIGNLLCPQWPCTGSLPTCGTSSGAEEEIQHVPAGDWNRQQESDLSNKSSKAMESQIGRDHGQDSPLLQQAGGQWRARTRSASKESVPATEGNNKTNSKIKELRDLAANGALSSLECVSENLQTDDRTSHQSSGAVSRFWLFLRDSPSKVSRRSAAAGLSREASTSVSTFNEQAVKRGGLEAIPEKAFSLFADRPHVSHKQCQTSSPSPVVHSSEACNHGGSSSTDGTN